MKSPFLIEETIRHRQGELSEEGALVVRTGRHTGRATAERYIVDRPETRERIHWSASNQPLPHDFARELTAALRRKLGESLTYRFQGHAAGQKLTVTSTSPWHIAFAANMFRSGDVPRFYKGLDFGRPIEVLHDPAGTVSGLGLRFKSETIIVLDPVDQVISIVGTAYAGEIKKSVFSLCNYVLPQFELLPMHASANCLKDGTETCLLFGLSGTGKTTLSASPDRHLIGDDEIVWSPSGVSNLEAGCYAKLIDLTPEREPEIHRAMSRFGAIAENVPFLQGTRTIDYASRELAENTRGSYPLSCFERVYDQGSEAEAPRAIVFLMADAFGALPAVARLNPWQAQYHFISGYTAKVAGTEIGVKEPKAVFSTCFGEPFMPRHPATYARLLASLMHKHQATAWVLNTGWTGGGYGLGERFPLAITRKILSGIQSGNLAHERTTRHPVFGFEVPKACAGVDAKWLEFPESAKSEPVAEKFIRNMERFGDQVDQAVLAEGGPTLGQRAA